MGKNLTDHEIIWQPNSSRVSVVKWPLPWIDGWRIDEALWCSCSWGASEKHVRTASFESRKALLFMQAMHIIVRDGVDHIALHNALLGLDEYIDGLASDMPGAV